MMNGGFTDKNDGDSTPLSPVAPREALLNLPSATKYFIILLLGIHALIQLLLNPERQYWVYSHFGFVAAAYTSHAPIPWTAFAAPLTYMLLHGNWAHVLINTVTLAAFGTGVERWIGAKKMIAFFILCGLAAIAVQF